MDLRHPYSAPTDLTRCGEHVRQSVGPSSVIRYSVMSVPVVQVIYMRGRRETEIVAFIIQQDWQ
jgi:hypothetical protein